ncbi:class I SAM-dependent methyltransferase [Nocardioides sp. LHG3406-4]|uniref:class I SAM-dependent methyltransferase n=1 Tax=Nocardioides sp. LHG3406-4 TaxID=2804575 RepID=UPI003CFB6E1E
MRDTRGEDYARRLQAKEGALWKRVLNVQAPYRWNLRRQDLGRTLDIGCGLGRNLTSLPPGSVGVDHNAVSVGVARERGLTALTTAEWEESELRVAESFDGFLVAHVIEHLPPTAGEDLMRSYVPYLRPGGKVLFICPQERGYASDPTHVRWTTGEDLQDLARTVGLEPRPWRSFPLPRAAGRAFVYNEFNVLATKPAR